MKELSVKEQYDIWVDYMVTQVYLQNWKLNGKLPFKDLKIKSFDEFIIIDDTRCFSNIYGWYYRFNNRIFKNNHKKVW
jgi:hypothetical protein